MLVNLFRLLARWIGERRGAEVGHFKFHGDAAFFLVVCEHPNDELQVVTESGGKLGHVFLLHPAVQHFLLQRNVDLFVRVARSLALVVEWPHKRVDEEDPRKALGIEVVSHHGAVRDRTLGVDFVENHVEISWSRILLFQLGLLRYKPLSVLGREIVVGISKQSLGCGNQFRVIVARAEGQAGVGR